MTLPPIGLGTKLRRLIALLDGDVQALYDESGLAFRPRFYPVFRQLMEGPASVGEIAAGANVTQPAATQTVHEMRKAGLVEINRGEDPRSRLVILSAEGRRLAGELRPVWQAVARAAAALDRELPTPLSATLDEAIGALERTPFRQRIHKEMDV